jgi:hypothetical protein
LSHLPLQTIPDTVGVLRDERVGETRAQATECGHTERLARQMWLSGIYDEEAIVAGKGLALA